MLFGGAVGRALNYEAVGGVSEAGPVLTVVPAGGSRRVVRYLEDSGLSQAMGLATVQFRLPRDPSSHGLLFVVTHTARLGGSNPRFPSAF